MINNKETQEFFEKNNYLKIGNFLNKDVTTLLYEYSKTQVQAMNFKFIYDKDTYDEDWDGNWSDIQALNRYCKYGDPIFDTLSNLSTTNISNLINKNLVCTYSYWRLYEHGDILKKHTDRPSCKYSATLCIGYDNSNVDKNKYPDYDWPMFVKDTQGNELPIHLKPGDLLIYRGDIIKHWRDKFLGINQTQVFLHYNEIDDKDNNHGPKDGRPLYGIPSKYRNIDY
jgi:hypothetical protein